MLGVKETALFLCSTVCLAESNLPRRPDLGDGAESSPISRVTSEPNRRSPLEDRLDSLTVKEFVYRLNRILFCEPSDLPLMLQRFVLEQREDLLSMCAAYPKDTPLREVMDEEQARLFLSSESMVSDMLDEVRVLVHLTGVLQSLDKIPKSQKLAAKTKRLGHALDEAKDDWERINYTAPRPHVLIQPIETLGTQVRAEYCLRVIRGELRTVISVEKDLKTDRGLRERTKRLIQEVDRLGAIAYEAPLEPKKFEAWRALLNKAIRAAATETLKIFETIKVSPADSLKSLVPSE